MAIRPAFLVVDDDKEQLVKIETFDFKWHSGLAKIQKQKSIDELHTIIKNKYRNINVLEVSSKSKEHIGNLLSAFNLIFKTSDANKYTVETLFQSSKVFNNGGPYCDLLYKSSLEAKKDLRFKNSGELLYFEFFGERWELMPTTAFYDWLYINALNQNKNLIKYVTQYNCFTDIEFNPKRSINCQAHSLALFVSLNNKNLLRDALSSRNEYLNIIRSYAKNQRQIGSQLLLY